MLILWAYKNNFLVKFSKSIDKISRGTEDVWKLWFHWISVCRWWNAIGSTLVLKEESPNHSSVQFGDFNMYFSVYKSALYAFFISPMCNYPLWISENAIQRVFLFCFSIRQSKWDRRIYFLSISNVFILNSINFLL